MIKRRTPRRSTSRHSLFKTKFRRLSHETLERRELLAAEVLAIRPDSAGLLQDGDVLNVAPREFNIFFKGGANLDESLISRDTIQLIRAGGDGDLATDPIFVELGYVGFVNPDSDDPFESQRLVMRPASSAANNATTETFAFPDDLYQIRLDASMLGSGADFAINFRLDRGAQVLSVIPQPVNRDAGGVLSQADDQILVYFDDQLLNLDDATDPKFFRLVNTGATLTPEDDFTLLPESADYDPQTNRVTLTFATAIPEGTYRLDIGASEGDSLTPGSAIRVGTLFDENSFVHNGFLGGIGGVSNNEADVDHYRLGLLDGADLSVEVTPHLASLDLTIALVDAGGNEISPPVVTGPGTAGTLNYTVPGDGDYFVRITSTDGSTGSYRIAVNVSGTPVDTSGNNSTFVGATQLRSLGAAGITIGGLIEPQSVLLPPRPGSTDEPGHRDIQREWHISLMAPVRGTNPQSPGPVRVLGYHFPPAYPNPTSPGESFLNQITEEEKRIVRALLDIFASHSGYQFVETPSSGFSVGKTDLRAFNPEMPPGAAGGLGGPNGAIVDASQFQDATRFFGDGFTGVMMHELGHVLGLFHSYELPSLMGAPLPNDVLPGDHDIVHLQRIVPPNSTDIDMYQFELSEAGRLSAETIAQRLSTPSLLDTVVRLYRRTSGGGSELIAQNDRYFGKDSFIELDLQPGTYFIGVSSTGNDSYDPNVPDLGFDGTTDGPYQLRLAFEANRGQALRDADGTAMDGNADGAPGGVHQFWFQAGGDVDWTIFVDRLNDPLIRPGGDGGNGSLANPFDRMSKALAESARRIVVPLNAADAIQPGDTFTIDDGITVATFTLDAVGPNPIDLTGLTAASEIAEAIRDAINGAGINVTASVAHGRIVQLSAIDLLDLEGSPALLHAPNLVRIVGNPGADGDLTTIEDNVPYLLGSDTSGLPLRDGDEFLVPQGVTVMIDAGTLIKLRSANLDAGTSSLNISRAASAIQVLGTPTVPVWLRSYHDDSAGGNSDGVGPAPQRGNFGGIVFRGDSDLETEGVFLNHVTHVDIRHGGGRVFVDNEELVFSPIHIEDARPAVRFNHLHVNADSAVSANPDSFNDSLGRIGPQVVGNFLQDNTIDGMFIRIRTEQGKMLDRLNVFGRLANTDITHVLTENLVIAGNPGGPLLTSGGLVARSAGRLEIDPGVVLKSSGARIEAERGAGTVIAEGTPNRPVILTSIADDRYGGSGSFDTNRDGFSTGSPGDWAGFYFGHLTRGSFDHALLTFGGGGSPVEGEATNFNVLEVHQADLRITNSMIRDNAGGNAAGLRQGRGANQNAVVYVRGSQPVIVDNRFIDNVGPAININANSLDHQVLPDYGRATGRLDSYDQFADNRGPLVRLNRLSGNSINGMLVRGEELTTESVWDDTDIVHVLQNEIIVDNHHTFSGLRLQSSNSESLVVKLAGGNAGFTATGTPLDIVDRIGGTVHVLGRPGFPVVLTHLDDDSVGAGFAPDGSVMTNTNNSGPVTVGDPGGWRGLLFDEWSNDRNVAIIREHENPLTAGQDINRTPATAQQLGTLAPNEKSGDENRRLGFEVHGWISPDDPGDVDVYSFRGTAGTPVWIDVDRTDPTLDLVVEVVTAGGTVLARSVRSGELGFAGNLNVAPLTQNPLLGGDFYTQNFRDPGLHYVLHGTPGTEGTYFIRVRSHPQSGLITDMVGRSSGNYQLQIRLQQRDEFPGSTVRFADIRFAQTAIDVRGLPKRSPLVGDAGEMPGNNNTFANAQQLVNLLETDQAAINISGALSGATDVDWYEFSMQHVGVQVIPGFNDDPGTVAVVFDLNYADALVRPDTTVAVYDASGRLIWIGRESNVEDDRPTDAGGNIDDLSRGSVGRRDPYIGPIHVRPNGTYYVAVMSNQQLPREVAAIFSASPSSQQHLVRLEPINTLTRVLEDHIGFTGYTSLGVPVRPETGPLIDLTDLDNHVVPFRMEDVVLYVATDRVETDTLLGNDDHLYTVNPFRGERYLTRVSGAGGLSSGVDDVQDLVIRSDGRFFGYQRLNGVTTSVGRMVEVDSSSGTVTTVSNDNIPSPLAPNTADLAANLGTHLARAEQFTTSDEVDAFTFQRRGTTGPASAPVPFYDTYMVVRETDVAQGRNSKLYRGRENGDATPAIQGGRRYGLMGDIQPAGVNFASTTFRAVTPGDPPQITDIRIESKLPGNAGNNINIQVSMERGGTALAEVTGVTGTTINLRIVRTPAADAVTGGPTAAQIATAFNDHPIARHLVTAVIVGGNAGNGNGNSGTSAVGFFRLGQPTFFQLSGPLTGGANGPVGPLAGRVTGLSYGNLMSSGNLFGVTNAGEFLEIDPNSGTVLRIVNTADTVGVPGLRFEGLALGPQNVQNGEFANTLFAVTADGHIVALDLDGNGVIAFDSGNASQVITVSAGTPTTAGEFTLTFDSGTNRLTTVPISVDAPSTVSRNEQQTVATVAHEGTFTLTFEKNQGAISSLAADINPSQTSFTIQGLSDLPGTIQWPATPFVVQVENEQMLVTSRVGNNFTVEREINGTLPAAHPFSATVAQVVTTVLDAPLSVTPQTALTAGSDLTVSDLLTVSDSATLSSPLTVASPLAISSPMTISNPLTISSPLTIDAPLTQALAASPLSTAVRVPNAAIYPNPVGGNYVIGIGNEQMWVTGRDMATNTLSVVRGHNATPISSHAINSRVVVLPPIGFDAQAINASETSLRVSDASVFPPASFVIRMGGEEMLVTDVDVTTHRLTVDRGFNGTTPAAHSIGDHVRVIEAIGGPFVAIDDDPGSTSLAVGNAAALPQAPFSIRVGDEQMRVTERDVVNNRLTVQRAQAGTTIDAHNIDALLFVLPPIADTINAIDDSGTSFHVVDASVFPLTPFTIRVGNEEMTVTDVDTATHTLTVVRERHGTTAQAHPVGSHVRVLLTISSTLSADVNDTETTLPVADASVFPPAPFVIEINDEQMRVTAVDTGANELTVQREFAGTTATAHDAGDFLILLDPVPPIFGIAGDAASTTLAVEDATVLPSAPFTQRTGSEEMLVTERDLANNRLTVQRGFNDTPISAHVITEPLVVLLPVDDIIDAIDADSTILRVADSTVYPAAPFSVQVDEEQMLVTDIDLANNQLSVLRGQNGTTAVPHPIGSHVRILDDGGPFFALDADPADTTLIVSGTAGFPDVPFLIRVGAEQMLVDAVDPVTNRLTVQRGQNGTPITAHQVDAQVSVLPVVGVTAAGGISETADVLEVVNASIFPPVPFTIRVNDEQMLVTAVDLATNLLSIDRGINGTAPAAHGIASIVQVLPEPGTGFVAITAAADRLRVVDASVFPTRGEFTIQVNQEHMLVTDVDLVMDELTVVRGQNGTTPADHDIASAVHVLAVPGTAATVGVPNDPDATVFSVADASVYPAAPFTIRVGREEMLVTDVNTSTDRLTVQRGQNGTPITFHDIGSTVQVVSDQLVVENAVPLLPIALPSGIGLRIGNEDLRIVSRVGNVFQVIRGAGGTAIAGHAPGTEVRRIETTAPIDYDAPAAAVRTALAALPTVGFNDLLTTDGPLSGFADDFVGIEFVNLLSRRDLPELTADRRQLFADEIQLITLGEAVEAGSFQLSFGGQLTEVIPFNADPLFVQAALGDLPGIGVGNVIVTGGNFPENPMQVRFVGSLSNRNLAELVSVNDTLVNNEFQTLTVVGNPTGGNFTLTFGEETTGNIPWNADAAAVQAAIVAGIGSIEDGDIVVTGEPLPGGVLTIEFIGNLANQNVPVFIPNSALTGGTTPQVLIETLHEGNKGATIETLLDGQGVDVVIETTVDGILSVRDALVGLASINPGDVLISGALQQNGVVVNFLGNYAGVNVPLMEPNNFAMLNGSLAELQLAGATDDAVADSTFINVSQIFGGGARPIGLAFSPLDFNLWHPTTRRGNDAGHGISPTPDDTRTPGEHEHNIATAAGVQRRVNEAEGGVSMHFGFEQWLQNQQLDSLAYMRTTPVNAQHGIRQEVQHRDLSSNAEIVGTYNFPGGALGSLVTNSFSLEGSVAADRPTLYFNYFLETENHPGANVTSDVGDPFRDSARVFASRNGGLTWELLSTNNSQLSGADPTVGNQRAELPGFLSHLSEAARNSDTPRAHSHQIVQELMDTGQWRQARVDLSTFADEPNLMLRFDFSTAGAMRDASLVGIDAAGFNNAPFGEFTHDTRSIRSMNNQFEGFYIDDIIVGYAERGEMVTGGFTPESDVVNLAQAGARTRNNDPNRFPDVLSGRYQLEIRRVDDVAVWVENEGVAITRTFHTNDRHVNTLDVTAQMGFELDDEPFDTSLPSVQELRALLDVLMPGTNIPDTPAVNADLLDAFEPWSAASAPDIDPISGNRSLASPADYGSMPGSIQALLPGAPAQRIAAVYQTTPRDLGAVDGRGLIRFNYTVDSLEDVHGLLFLVDGELQILTPSIPLETGEIPATPLASGNRRNVMFQIPFNDPDAPLTWVYRFFDQQDNASGLNRAWIDDVVILQGDRATGFEADRNRPRQQGIFIAESNVISRSGALGINVQPGQAEAPGVTHPGATVNFPQVNTDRLVPGVVIVNNIITGSSGIRYAGENSVDAQRPVPFGRIINNTLVGDGFGVGVQVAGIAGPTVMNNIITGFASGIGGATGNTVIRTNYFQGNGNNGPTGTDPIIRAPGTPLFVDAANNNFYPAADSGVLDRSLSTLQDRFNFVNFKNEIGIPPSPIFAPSRDVFGQLRVDSSASPGGGGSDVFIDIGAVDRSDSAAPFAVLVDPIDNDIAQVDLDPNRTVVLLQDPIKEFFSFLLTDGRGPNAPFEGTGIDPLTVSRDALTVRRNNVPLTEGVDFVLGFNKSTGEMRLTPLSTLWEPSGVYEITLDNDVIADRAGNLLRANQPDGSTQFHIILSDVLFDFGDAPNSFGTLLESDGARHALINDAMPRLGRRVDAEIQAGSPAFPDDTPSDIAVTLGPGTTGIDVDGNGTPRVEIRLTVLPLSGDSLTIDVGNGPVTFEFVPLGVAPRSGNVAVRFDAGDNIETVTASLLGAIDAQFAAPGDAFIAELDADSADTIVLQNFDDEDGVGITTLDDGNLNPIIFVRPDGSSHPEFPTSVDDADDVLGFLNPLDPAGALIAITVTGAGFLDAWIDFNGNGVFDTDEKIFDSVPVVDGLNVFMINPPAGAADGIRWARFRVSPEGGLQPTGLAVGGEVEDYRVQVIRIALPDLQDDAYTMLEDGTLDTAADGEVSVMFNDVLDANTFTIPTALIVDGPQFAVDFSFDPQTGHFAYTPLTDFSGLDTFTYYVALQQSAIDEMPPGTALATVTIDVRPVNDPPFAEDQAFITLEDTVVTITAEELLAGARPHVDPQYPPGAPAAPWDESNQTLRVISIEAGSTTVTAANAANGPFTAAHGQIEAVFDDTTGWLVSLTYLPNLDQNRDTVTLLSYNGGGVYDLFQFTVEDDGELIDPVDGSIIQGTSLTHTATATIDVAPQNDDPIAEDDLITVGLIGSGTISPIDVLTAWSQFFIGSGLSVPIPGEDTPLMIPAEFLLQNDLTGPLTATDENQFINDGPLRIIAASINNRDATVELVEQDGDVVGILLTPPSNIYGRISFTYTIEDRGIDEDINGNRVLAPRTAVGTVTVDIQPVNDPPNVPDRELRFAESADPGPSGPFTFTAEQLLDGSSNEGPAVPGPDDPTLGPPFDESEQSFRIVAFRTTAGSVDVNDLPGGTGTLTLASDAGGAFEFDFVGGAFTVARFVTATDYNERTPFAPFEILRFTIEDDGLTTDPQTGDQVTLPAERSSDEGTLQIRITEANDAPIFTMPNDFIRDENDGTPWVQTNFVTGIAPGPLTALDELQRQDVTFSFVELNVPVGMMTALPTIDVSGGPGNWPGTGTLTVFPAADAFGFAVYEVIATDTDPTNPRTTTQTLTVTINPINDIPVAFERHLNVVEAVEMDGETALLTFDAGRLLTGVAPELPSVEGAFPDTLSDLYNETEQTLRVVAFGVPGAANVDVTVDETGLVAGTGSVTRTTVTGGTLTFIFESGEFVSGSYAPAIDYNERMPFDPSDLFTYVIADDGRTTLPGSGFVNFNGSSTDSTIIIPEERSVPATVTITVTQKNDPPIFTMPADFAFDENEGQAVVQTSFVTMVAPGELTALDELQRQNVSFSVTPVNVATGMMMLDANGVPMIPTIDVTAGSPDNWTDANGDAIGTARLTVFPAADAFGFAVYLVTVTDNDPVDPRSTTQLLTVAINPINDVPFTYDRELNVVEAVEVDGEVALLPFTASRLIQGMGAELPSVAGLFPPTLIDPYNETEQVLRVVAFGIPGAADVDVAIDEPGLTGGTGTVTRTTVTGGTLTFNFVAGAFTSGSYAPAVDYNERTPFDAEDLFTFIISDDGRATLPGSGFVDFGGSSTDSTIFIPELRSAAATVTITVTQKNDPPIFTMPSGFNFDENQGEAIVAVDFVTMIAPGALTALDELQRQNVSFSFTEVNVPEGMMVQNPTITVNGGPGNWPGSGTLTVYPATDAYGFAVYLVTATDNDPVDPRTTTQLLTVTINPINDVPVAHARQLTVVEAVEFDGEVALLSFTREQLLMGSGSELPSAAGAFAPTLIAPYNESEQRLRIVRFEIPDQAPVDVTVDEPGLVGGTGTVTRVTRTINNGQLTPTSGILTFEFLDGEFISGSYSPAIDYNERTPFDPVDPFTYFIADDGRTTLPGSGFIDGSGQDTTIYLPPLRSVGGTISIRVTQANDPPQFDFQPVVNVLERDDSGTTNVSAWATNIAPGPATALDELARQSVSFTYIPELSDVPAGLFRLPPVVSDNGTLSVFPARDAVGTAVIVMRATDFEPTAGFVSRSTDATFTVNVQPVNDRPAFIPATFGSSDSLDADTAWNVLSNGTIRYTLRENNAQADGDTSVDFFIPLRALDVIDVYNQIGLLNIFRVGPPNEADDTPGGSQTLSLAAFPATTALGGLLTPVIVDGRMGLNYRPPANANFSNSGLDSFTYMVTDDGQTYVLGINNFVSGTLIDDPLTINGRVELRLNPVNNPPEFALPATYVEAAEDTAVVIVNGFATEITPGPAGSTDEASQTVSFTVNSLNFTRGGADDPFGTGFPQINPSGRLTFQPLPDVFGIFEFEVILVDSGPGSETGRGDNNRSAPHTITIQIQPVNDPPVMIANPVPLAYEVLEDNSLLIPVDGIGLTPGLMDNFRVGPANEAADILPLPGGNQTLSLLNPPTQSNRNGTLAQVFDENGNLTHLRYTPRLHFAGIDTFTFTLVDDGVTVDLGTDGTPRPDPRITTGTVSINVLPVNDAPIFSGGGDVTSAEDAGLVTITNWATGVQAGPAGADDELTGFLPGLPSIAPQTLQFIITRVDGEGSTMFSPLFTVEPTVTVTGTTATLTYQTAEDANGVAVFEAVLRDDGPNDPLRGDVNASAPIRFTITVGAVNDPPQFTAGPDVTVIENSGPYSQQWATDILPGPITAIDELATQTVSFEVEHQIVSPVGFSGMFAPGGAPAIDALGVLTFTPAENAAGEVSISVTAVDSAGGRSEPLVFTILISDTNQPPVAADLNLEGDEDNLLEIPAADLLAIASDPDLLTNPDEFLTFTEMASVSLAGATIRVTASGDFEYDPRGSALLQALAPDEFFLDSFTYRVIDAEGAISNIATVTVNVAGINDAPTVNPNFVFAAPGQMIVIAPLENDFDVDGTIDPSTIFITRQPPSGTLVVRSDGTLLYTPSPGFRGQDLIRYTVADNLGQQSEQATITINVSDPPVAVNDSDGTYFEDTLEIDLAQNDSGVASELDVESIVIVTPPSNGTVTILGGGRVSYQAEDGFVGTDSFQYTISDVDGRTSNIGTVTIQVVGSQLQNPIVFSDVSGDGSVTPFDALLILNRLSLGQRQGFVGGIPVEAIANELPQRFYDVDGNGRVEPLDALRVMNQIAQNNRMQVSGEGEALASAPAIIVASFNNSTPVVATAFTVMGDAIAEADIERKIADFELVDDDSYSLLATDLIESRSEKKREAIDLELVDAIWGDLG